MSLPRFLTSLLGSTPLIVSAQQILIVDDAHLQLQAPGAAKPSVYVIRETSAVELDASKYTFKLLPQLQGKPLNAVQVLLGKDQQYTATWPLQPAKVLLSASTLKANAGSKPFIKFATGQTWVFAIGNLEASAFSPVWIGIAKVE